MAVGNRALGGFTDVLVVPVGHKALQAADAHRFPFDAPDTFGLTLGFLGADTAAHSGQGALLGDDLVGALKVPLGHLFNEIRDVDANRAAGQMCIRDRSSFCMESPAYMALPKVFVL